MSSYRGWSHSTASRRDAVEPRLLARRVVDPILPGIARELGASHFMVELVFGTYHGAGCRAYASAEPDSGALATRIGSKRTQQAAPAQSVSPAQTREVVDRETTVAVPKTRHIAAEVGLDLVLSPLMNKDGDRLSRSKRSKSMPRHSSRHSRRIETR